MDAPGEITLHGQAALDALANWPANFPLPKIKARGFVWGPDGHVFFSCDEHMQLVHPDDWLLLSEDERDFLIHKHGEHNKPKGV